MSTSGQNLQNKIRAESISEVRLYPVEKTSLQLLTCSTQVQRDLCRCLWSHPKQMLTRHPLVRSSTPNRKCQKGCFCLVFLKVTYLGCNGLVCFLVTKKRTCLLLLWSSFSCQIYNLGHESRHLPTPLPLKLAFICHWKDCHILIIAFWNDGSRKEGSRAAEEGVGVKRRKRKRRK